MNFEICSMHELRELGYPAVRDGYKIELDQYLAYIPGADNEQVWRLTIVVAPMCYCHTAAMYISYLDGDAVELVGAASDMDMYVAIKKCCFDVATRDFFLQLHDLERNCEDAVNKLAYDAMALYDDRDDFWNYDFDVYVLDYFLGLAREYVKTYGPAEGIEWEEF